MKRASSAFRNRLPRALFTSERLEKFVPIDAFAAAERLVTLIDLLPQFLNLELPKLIPFLEKAESLAHDLTG
jgi:hypothetical protein